MSNNEARTIDKLEQVIALGNRELSRLHWAIDAGEPVQTQYDVLAGMLFAYQEAYDCLCGYPGELDRSIGRLSK